MTYQQAGQGVIGFHVVRVQFDPELGCLQGFRLALHKLGQMGGVGADPGIAQNARLGQIIFQGHVISASSQGEFGYQQGIQAVLRERPLNAFWFRLCSDACCPLLGQIRASLPGNGLGAGGAGAQQHIGGGDNEKAGHSG